MSFMRPFLHYEVWLYVQFDVVDTLRIVWPNDIQQFDASQDISGGL